MRKVNTSGLHFSDLMEDGKYYVDKTLLIKDILDTDDRGIHLYVRPRRFGKSTNITMLDSFFNIRYRGNTWFDELIISEHEEYDCYKNRFPVIYLNLKDIVPSKGRDFRYFLDRFKSVLAYSLDDFGYLLESEHIDAYEKDLLNSILYRNMDDIHIVDSIRILCNMLRKHHGSNTVILIDEYDRAITDTFGLDFQGDIIEFMGEFFSSTFKDNRNLQLGYITGIMQVAKAGIFSGMNNVYVNNVFSKKSGERFGFTESEVRGLLEHYGHPEKYDEVKEWYDGYCFGDSEVYNPFSLVMYLAQEFRPSNYWMNSSKDLPLRWLIQKTDRNNLDNIANIVNGYDIECTIHDSITYDELKCSTLTDLYTLLTMTGYLTASPIEGDRCRASIPNKEVKDAFLHHLRSNVNINSDIFGRFHSALMNGDAETMSSTLQEILCDASYFNLKDETSYELILLTMMHGMLAQYKVTSQKESGNGRLDLLLTPVKEGLPHMILELKVSDSMEGLEDSARDAIDQIHRKNYYLGMKGYVILVGLAFYGKVPFGVTEVISV